MLTHDKIIASRPCKRIYESKRNDSKMLDKSRFCRRLHSLEGLLFSLFFQLGQYLKDISGASDYVIDSFPVAVCDNIRIKRCKILKGEKWRGKQTSMRPIFLWSKSTSRS